MTISIGRVEDPTTAKKIAPAAKPTPTGMIIGFRWSHRVWWPYQITAKMSPANRIGSVVPAIRRPLTIVAMIGVAINAAPGNAVFDRPTIRAAMQPRIRLPAVNTGAAYVGRFRCSDVGPRARMCSRAGATMWPAPLHSLRSLTTHRSPKDGDSNEQGKIRAEQAARQHWHDGSHRPRQDHADCCDLQDACGEGVGQLHAVRSDRQGA